MGVEERAILGAVIGVCQRAPRRPRSKEVSEKLPSHRLLYGLHALDIVRELYRWKLSEPRVSNDSRQSEPR